MVTGLNLTLCRLLRVLRERSDCDALGDDSREGCGGRCLTGQIPADARESLISGPLMNLIP